jgi:hypothetical protein
MPDARESPAAGSVFPIYIECDGPSPQDLIPARQGLIAASDG